jgi:hypothetical protein
MGKYPPQPSSYILLGGSRVEGKVPSKIVQSIKADIDLRLAKCGVEGKLLKAECIAQMEIGKLQYESRNALEYIGSGDDSRRMDYITFKKQNNYRENNKQKINEYQKVFKGSGKRGD